MENEQEYQNVLVYQNHLNAELNKMNKGLLHMRQDEAIQLIEEHFQKAEVFLCTRKDKLVATVTNMYSQQLTALETHRKELEDALAICLQIKNTAAQAYAIKRDVGLAVLATAKSDFIPSFELENILVSLPVTLFELIDNHGEVELISKSEIPKENIHAYTSKAAEDLQDKLNSQLTLNSSVQAVPSRIQLTESVKDILEVDLPAPLPIVSTISPQATPREQPQATFSFSSFFSRIKAEPKVIGGSLRELSSPLAFDQIPFLPLSKSTIGSIRTLAGGTSAGFTDGFGSIAKFCRPRGIFFNPSDQFLYVCDNGNRAIRKVSLTGEVSLVALHGKSFSSPTGLAFFLRDNSLFVSDKLKHTIDKVVSGRITTFAGSGTAGSKDGPKEQASFCKPSGITVDQQTGTLYVSDKGSHTIRKITPEGEVTTIAGTAGKRGTSDGVGKNARFDCPKGIWYSELYASVFVCDYNNHKIRMVNTCDGKVSTLNCPIKGPHCITVLSEGTILATSYWDNKIIKVINNNGTFVGVEVIGSGQQKEEDGPPAQCAFNRPYGISFDPLASTCFIADYRGHTIRILR